MKKLLGVKPLGADMYDMNGRTVRISETQNVYNCLDCDSDAYYRVHEQASNACWYWCGQCSIGG